MEALPAFAGSLPVALPRQAAVGLRQCSQRRVPNAVAVERGPGGHDAPLQRRLGIRDPWDQSVASRSRSRARAAAANGPVQYDSINIPAGARVRGDLEEDLDDDEEVFSLTIHAPKKNVAASESNAAVEKRTASSDGSRKQGALEGTAVDDLEALPSSGEAGAPVPAKPWDSTTGVHGISYLGRRVAFLQKRTRLVQHSYEECRRITELYSKTFYTGTSILPAEKRKAIFAIYTWCRRTDELVDGPRVSQRSDSLNTVLDDWRSRLEDLFFRGKAKDSLDLAMVDVCNNYPDLTIEPFREMINGMQMDVDMDRFETWDDLYLYCYRVAGTVGLMSLPIMGTVRPGTDGLREASESALALGIGLQLTNILRDVGEDRLRGRIYLPLEDLRRFNYTADDLMACVNDSRYKALMKYQIGRARRYFARARYGIQLLNPDARLPVQASLDMYSQILDVIEKNNYDNFHSRAYISKRQKLATIPMSYLRISDNPAAVAVLSWMDQFEESRSDR